MCKRIIFTLIVIIIFTVIFIVCKSISENVFGNMITISSYLGLPISIIAFIWTYQGIINKIKAIKEYVSPFEEKQDLWIGGNLTTMIDDLITLVGSGKFKTAKNHFLLIRRFLTYALSEEVQKDLNLRSVERRIRAYANSSTSSPVAPKQIQSLENSLYDIRDHLDSFYNQTKKDI